MRAGQGKKQAMDKLTSVISPEEVNPAVIADVRSVPLGLLQDHPDCYDLASWILDRHSGSSHVPVAAFSSAI
jgi:hypothetical protein